jgi:hypothetical protein
MAEAGYAQNTGSGDIRGTVTDSTGAVIPGVTITVQNLDTGVSKNYVSDNAGLYDTSSIVTGRYRLTFTRQGFEELIRGPVTIDVGYTTVNAELKVGSTTQSIVVNTDVPLLTTESGEVAITLPAETLDDLPQTGADWENFTILLPGASGTPTSSEGSATNPSQFASVNGNLPYNAILADGAVNTLPSSSNANVSNLETIAELQVNTANFSAQYGIGGYVFNQISKGGTAQFHGSLYEYFRNSALNAKGYAFGRSIAVPYLRYNNYGGTVGGPILKKKMFFFFNFDKVASQSPSTGFITVPTAAELAGDFTGQATIYDPTTQVVTNTSNGPVVTRQTFAAEYGNGNKIPPGLISNVAKALQAFYPAPNDTGTVSEGVTINNYYYSVVNPEPSNKFFGRLDYDITPTNRLTLSETERNLPYYDACPIYPIGCYTSEQSSDNAQITDVWNITSKLVNEARVGFSDQPNYYQDPTLGQNYPQKLGWQFATSNDFPTISISGNCCYNFAPGIDAVQKEQVFDYSDVVTMIRGRHVLHFGGELLVFRSDETAWGNFNSGTMSYSGQYTASTVGDSSTGIGYADFLLGDTQSWYAANSPEYGPRQKNPQWFVQDDIKVHPNLTLNLGVRYQIQTGWSDSKNNLACFDPTVLNPATNTKGAIWYAVTHANGRTALQATNYSTVLPRVGASWQLMPNTTIRGGFGIFAYRWDGDVNGGGEGLYNQSFGDVSDQTNGIYPVVLLDANASTAFAELPYVGPTTDPAALNGQGGVTYNEYHTPVPQNYQWDLGVQRMLGTNFLSEVDYIGSHAKNLAFPVDIDQVPESELGPNDAPTYLPYPNYQSIYGNLYNGISNYNSLQASITKRMSSGMDFSFNYVWSHFLDDQDSSGLGGAQGTQDVQNSYSAAQNYGSSNFDVRNAFKGRMVYKLPFGKGERFLNQNRLLDAVIGGWQTAGTIVLSDGVPFTPLISGANNSYSQGNNWYANQIGKPKLANRGVHEWFNPDAYTLPAPGTFGNERRNSVYGPGFEIVNLAASKTFRIEHGIDMKIQAMATNAFNHTNFNLPHSSLVAGGPGSTPSDPFYGSNTSITRTQGGGRSMELYGKITF